MERKGNYTGIFQFDYDLDEQKSGQSLSVTKKEFEITNSLFVDAVVAASDETTHVNTLEIFIDLLQSGKISGGMMVMYAMRGMREAIEQEVEEKLAAQGKITLKEDPISTLFGVLLNKHGNEELQKTLNELMAELDKGGKSE